MKPILLGMVTVAFVTIRICSAADDTNSVADTIRLGTTNSTLIVSGKFTSTLKGGGGATGSAKIVEVFKAPTGFKETNTLPVFWMSEKKPEYLGTNTFLLFLRPVHDAVITGYEDATGLKHSFVPASRENIRLLKSRLAESK